MLDKREWRGLAAAPAPFFALFLLPLLLALLHGNFEAASFMPLALLLAYAPVLALGLPAHLLLRRFGRRNLAAYLSAGFGEGLALGLLIYAANHWVFPVNPRNPFAIHVPLAAAFLAGAMAFIPASIFWCIAVRRSSA